MSDLTIILLVSTALSVTGITTFIVVRMVREIHLQLNSRLDQLLILTQTSSHAEGVEDERLREKGRLLDKEN